MEARVGLAGALPHGPLRIVEGVIRHDGVAQARDVEHAVDLRDGVLRREPCAIGCEVARRHVQAEPVQDGQDAAARFA